jgi:hypothetical protein
MTTDKTNLENIDFNAFFDMDLSDEDKAREADFLHAQSGCLHRTPVVVSSPLR